MPAKKKPPVTEKDLGGLKYLKAFTEVLKPLHEVGTERDRAGNRELFFDHYTGLVLLYFFNPTLTSLRGIQQASELEKVQRLLRCSRASLGSLSEAAQVFDPQVLKNIISELAARVPRPAEGVHPKALEGLTAVDGTLLPALPKMAWALWLDESNRAAKMHLAFEVFRSIPVDATVTEGNGSEKKQLRALLEPGRLYALDRGYADYELFQQIIASHSSFIGRVQNNAVYQVVEERPVTPEAKAAGVRRDLIVRLGGKKTGAALEQPLHLVEVATGKLDAGGNPEVLLLVTDRIDLPADLVALGYRYRWTVELFFRWFKCILGCRHLISHSQDGVEIQAYVALIASLLVSVWTGRKPSKRTFEMLCHYFTGWAGEEELLAHIAQLEKHNQ